MSTEQKYRLPAKEKYLKTDILYIQPDLNVDAENGIIRNVSVCTAGEAKGHGVFLEDEFISDVVMLGNSYSQGLKCRFGHPTMSGDALGTYLGRFKNFRVVGSKAVADLHLDDIAKKSPNGDLYSYVVEMAKGNADMLGASICFEPDDYYFYDEQNNRIVGMGQDRTYVKIKSLFATDVVDDPAANEAGLFSSSTLNASKFAVVATKFLDGHPDIWTYLDKHPGKFEPFLRRYAAYKQRMDKAIAGKRKKGFFARLAAALVGEGLYTTIDTVISTGENIRIEAEGEEPAPGDEVYFIQEDGTELPAPDGDHTISSGDWSGRVISVVDGKITSVRSDTASQEGTDKESPVFTNGPRQEDMDILGQQVQDFSAAIEKLHADIAFLRTELATIKGSPMEQHTSVGAEDDPVGLSSVVEGDEGFWRQPWNRNKRK